MDVLLNNHKGLSSGLFVNLLSSDHKKKYTLENRLFGSTFIL
jgi:hypothetical protein